MDVGEIEMRGIVPPVLAICSLLLVVEARADDKIADLVGTWTGGGLGVGKSDGWSDDPVTLVIAEQRGRAFMGKKTHSEGEEGFYGAIMADGQLLITDDGDGHAVGSVLNADSIEVCYMESGADAQVFCRILNRSQ